MRRQHLLFTFAAAVMLILSSVAVSAQTGQLFGEVSMKQADGTEVPAAGAAIDVYRTDISGKYSTKTDKKGKFMFAGLPYVGVYVVAASAPNARPDAISGVKAGREINVKLTLMPGDGKRLTEAEAKSMGSSPGPSGSGGDAPKESAEDRKKREELEAKNKEIMAQNEKNTKINEVINRTFVAGNKALNEKHYDEAVAAYDEGLAADAEQPALLTNRAEALRLRGTERYNSINKQADEAAKNAMRDSAFKDFKDAADSATKAVEMLKAAPAAGADQTAQANRTSNLGAAVTVRAFSMRLFALKVDQSQLDSAFAAYQEYIALQTDPAKKLKAQLEAAQMYLDAGQGAKAQAEFQKILAANPDSMEAELGLGLSLFSTGDKANFQEAANHLQRFIDKAPDTHPLKQSAKESLDYLKTQENVKPQKTTTTGGRRRG